MQGTLVPYRKIAYNHHVMTKERSVTPEERRQWRQAMGEEPADPCVAEMGPTPAVVPAARTPTILPGLAVLSGRQAARVLKPHAPVGAVLDLHGSGKIDAYGMVRDFILQSRARGMRHVLIITGKGRTSEGVLRANLPHWLNEPGLRPSIAAIAQGSANRGGSGVFHVLLKRP